MIEYTHFVPSNPRIVVLLPVKFLLMVLGFNTLGRYVGVLNSKFA
jgi:hypothetical protein